MAIVRGTIQGVVRNTTNVVSKRAMAGTSKKKPRKAKVKRRKAERRRNKFGGG